MAEIDSQNKGQTEGQNPEPAKMFSQADVDRFIKERLERERSKYADYETLKTAADKLKQIEDANKTELEKANAAAAETLKKLEDANKRAADAEAKAKTEALYRRVIGLASSAGAIDPQDANILAATSSIDPAAEKADDLIKDAIEAVKKNRPYLFKQGNNSQVSTFNPGTGGGAGETDRQRVQRLTQTAGYGRTPLG